MAGLRHRDCGHGLRKRFAVQQDLVIGKFPGWPFGRTTDAQPVEKFVGRLSSFLACAILLPPIQQSGTLSMPLYWISHISWLESTKGPDLADNPCCIVVLATHP